MAKKYKKNKKSDSKRVKNECISKVTFDKDKELEFEIKRENSLVTQAGLMMAVFSFSTSALFKVWEMGTKYIIRVAEWIMHLGISIITVFLLFSMLFSVIALLKSKVSTTNLDIYQLQKTNNKRAKNIKLSIIFFIIALITVFIEAIYILLRYYLFFNC